MTGFGRKLGLAVVALAALTAESAFAQDLEEMFSEGVTLLKRGRDAEALEVFKAILAEDPSQADAYELMRATDGRVWIDILTKEGEFELVAKDLMERARLGRAERRTDEDAIRALVDEVLGGGSAARTAIRTLATEHGEYAVPMLLPYLADPNNDERRVLVVQALTQMDTDVVLPLIEGLGSEDGYLRRNIALVLGYVGDARAVPVLAQLANADADGAVQAAAAGSLQRMEAPMESALDLYLRQGDDYLNRRDSVLKPFQYSQVVWSWDGSGLTSAPIRRELYNDELAKRAFARALALDPSSVVARAGLVRAYVSQNAKVAELSALGEDVAGLEEWAAEGRVAVSLAGADAVDGALRMALQQNDQRTSIGLCRALGAMSDKPTAGLDMALASGEGATRAEAAIALGRIAVDTGSPVPAAAVGALTEAAGREIVRIVAVIDSNAERNQGVVQALSDRGYMAYGWEEGAKGLSMLKRVSGVDAVLVGDTISDLTPFQVLDALERDPRTAGAPRLVLSSAEGAADLYGEQATAVIDGAGALAAVDEALVGNLNLERERANRLAVEAATALAHLARNGGNVSGALAALTGTLANRPDGVTLPAMETLGIAGGAEATAPLAAVVADGERSDEARQAAARALGLIFRRGASADTDTANALVEVIGSDAALGVRTAAAYAIGSLDLSDEQRAEALAAMAVEAAAEE